MWTPTEHIIALIGNEGWDKTFDMVQDWFFILEKMNDIGLTTQPLYNEVCGLLKILRECR
jgi:hypothetical protein